MEAIISALGLILSALMDLPSRTTAASEAKKAAIGKTLAQFVGILDSIIARGYLILSKLEALAILEDSQKFIEKTKELNKLIKNQVRDLGTAASMLQKRLMRGIVLWNIPGFGDSNFLYTPTNVQRVLSIYKPDLGPALHFVIEWKTNILTGLAEKFAQNTKNFEISRLTVKELVYIDHELLKDQFLKFDFLATLPNVP